MNGRRFALGVVALVAVSAVCSPARADMMFEVGEVTVPVTLAGQTAFHQVTFQQAYSQPPLVFSLATNAGSDPAALRVRNVTTTGFEISMVEPKSLDGAHGAAMQTAYLAVEPGAATLPGGLTIEAGSISTATTIQKDLNGSGSGSFESISFASSFASAPALLLQIQTMNNEAGAVPGAASDPWMTASAGTVSATDAEIALGRAETATSATPLVQAEQLAYVALSVGTGTIDAAGGASVTYDAFRSPDVITGWENTSGAGNQIDFNAAFDSPPLVIATISKRDGADGGWMRRGDVTASSVWLTTDEDTFYDAERSHTSEVASVVAFSEPFVVPEPTTLLLLALGALAMPKRRRA